MKAKAALLVGEARACKRGQGVTVPAITSGGTGSYQGNARSVGFVVREESASRCRREGNKVDLREIT